MTRPNWRGIFAIPVTPFTETGDLDVGSLRSQIAFCLEAGAHGLVAPVNASEFWTLSDEERRTVAEVLVKEVDGRIPTVIGVAAGSAPVAVAFAKHAEAIGADAVIAMPPHARTAPLDAIFAYYRALAEAIAIPIFIQNADPPGGTRLSPEFVGRLVRELPNVDWIKEETWPAGHAMSAEIAHCGPKLGGIMGGIAGRYLLDEYRRGACGTMPACEATDLHVQVWDALEAGDERRARDVQNRLLPLLNFEALMPGVYNAVLKRRGVIASDYLRHSGGSPLDAFDHQELTAIFADLRDLFRLAPPV